MIPETLAHYRILKKLGQGGMGEVYLALDTVLERQIAVKILPEVLAADPKKLARFDREAKMVAALNHPNIVTLYSVEHASGLHFLTMELVDGQSLDKAIADAGMELRQIFEIGIALADALVAAHNRGITHRDIKPANVMLTPEGRVKVLDFGLAKVLYQSPDRGDSHAPTQRVTEEGTIQGTVPYMSPEQIEGRSLDVRSDIFSFGVVLYEMATGHRPFQGASTAALISAILRDQPPAVDELRMELPRHLGRIVRHCLEKDPSRRFQSALDVRNELEDLNRETSSVQVPRESAIRPRSRDEPPAALAATKASSGLHSLIVEGGRDGWIRIAVGVVLGVLIVVGGWRLWRASVRTTSPNQRSIAVLPFQNLYADAAIEHLALAVPGEITTVLSRSPALTVRPFATTASLVGGSVDLQGLGRQVGAANLVTGQYYRESERLFVTLEAVDVDANRLLWRDSMDVPKDDLIALRQAVTQHVRQGLMPRLGAADDAGATEALPENEEAYRLFLRGITTPTDPEPNRRAIEMLEQSVELDPTFAPAWAELSTRYHYEGAYAGSGVQYLDKAVAAALEALRLDPELVQAAIHLIMYTTESGDLGSAYERTEELLQRRPENGDVHFARSYVLRYAGLLDESKRECDIALALDSTNRRFRSCSLVFEHTRDFERARVFLDLDRGSEWAAATQGSLSLRSGNDREALEHYRAAGNLRAPPIEYIIRCLEGAPRDELDSRAREIEEAIAKHIWDPEQFYGVGAGLARCGSTSQALSILRVAIEGGYCAYPLLEHDPHLTPIRDTPEFSELRDAGRACRERFLAETRAGGS